MFLMKRYFFILFLLPSVVFAMEDQGLLELNAQYASGAIKEALEACTNAQDMQWLIARNASPEHNDEAFACLLHSVSGAWKHKDKIQTMQWLLQEHNVNPRKKMKDESLPLHKLLVQAVARPAYEFYEEIALLISYGADPNDMEFEKTEFEKSAYTLAEEYDPFLEKKAEKEKKQWRSYKEFMKEEHQKYKDKNEPHI